MSSSDDERWGWPIAWGVGLIAPPVTLVVPAVYHAWPLVKRAWTAHARRREEARRVAAVRAEETRRRRAAEAEAEAYRRSLPPPPPPPPPPPTTEELREQARTRYEATLRTLAAATLSDEERRFAREQAKQVLFRELDRLMTR